MHDAATPIPHRRTGTRLDAHQARVPDGLYRIDLPAGTLAWSFSAHTYGTADGDSHAALRLDTPPPAAAGQPLAADTRTALPALLAGDTLHYLCPALGPGLGNAGGFAFATHQRDTPPAPLDRARTAYLRVSAAGGLLLDLVSQIELGAISADPADPADPVAPDLSARTLQYLRSQGFEATTIAQLQADPGLWSAVLLLADAAERGGADRARQGTP